MESEGRMTKLEGDPNDELGLSTFVIPSSLGIRHSSFPRVDAISPLPFNGDYCGQSGAKLGWRRVQLDSDVDDGVAPHAHALRLRNILRRHLVIRRKTDGRDSARKLLAGKRGESDYGF